MSHIVLDELDLFKGDGVLTSLPFGKLASFLAKKAIEIADKDKALCHLFRLAYLESFQRALVHYNVDIDSDITRIEELKSFIAGEMDGNGKYKYKAEQFNKESINTNMIFTDYQACFMDFLTNIGANPLHKGLSFLIQLLKIIIYNQGP